MNMFPRMANLVSDIGGVPLDQVTPEATPESLDFDSLSLVELEVSIRNKFDILFEEGELRRDQTIKEMSDALSAKISDTIR